MSERIVVFFRGESRGLIEASARTSASGSRSRFSAVKAAASLKPKIQMNQDPEHARFFRGESRGLIEATPFRAPVPEARLFFRGESRGLIEAYSVAFTATRSAGFFRGESRGLIEAYWVC